MPMSQHRPALAAILVAVAAVLSFAVLVPASAGSPGAAIANGAVKYDGTYQGECWTFVKKVVAETTGRQIGFDYRQGFFDAGAIEVALSDATTGDIIQIADDNNTAPDADYPGLHTSIILTALGGGDFQIIDSNSNFDGVVHIRETYSPQRAAARYPGLTFHVYRIIGSGPTPQPQPASTGGATTSSGTRGATSTLVPVDAAAVNVGDRLVTNTPDDVLRLRSAPNGIIITVLQHRTVVTIAELAGFANGYHWARVKTNFGEGYVAIEFLANEVASTTPPAASSTETAGTSAAAPSGSRTVSQVRPFRSFVPALTANN